MTKRKSCLVVVAALVLAASPEVRGGRSELAGFLAPTPAEVPPLALKLVPEDFAAKNFSEWRDCLRDAATDRRVPSAHVQALAAGRPVVVTLAPGTYCVPHGSMSFKAADAGTPAAPLTFRAARPGTVKLTGTVGLPAGGFRKVRPGDGQFDRLPPACRGSVWVTTLPEAVSLQDNAPCVFEPDEQATHDNPELPAHEFLYLDGRLQDRARWPNRDRDDSVGWTNFPNVVAAQSPGAPMAVETPDDRMKGWRDLAAPTNGVMFRVTLPWCWHDEYVGASSFDRETRRLTFFRRLDYGDAANAGTSNQAQRFVAVNVIEELDAPGEWWLDHRSRQLYYYPPQAFFDGGELVLVSYKDKLLDFTADAHDIRFENLGFAYSGRIANIDAGSSRIVFENCEFHSFHTPSRIKGTDYTFRDCRFHDFPHAVFYDEGGDMATLRSSGNLFEGCSFRRFTGRYLSHYGALVLNEGSGSAVRQCSFADAPHTAIAIDANNAFVGWCDFSDLMHETIDSGMIYAGHTTRYLGNIVAGCRMRGSRPTTALGIPKGDVRSFAVYFDDGLWGGDVIGCDIDGTVNSVFLRGGNLHRVMWNRVTGATCAMSVDRCVATADTDAFLTGFTADTWNSATGDNWFTSWYDGVNARDKNRVALVIDRRSRLWRTAFPTLNATIEDPVYRIEPWNNRLEGNVFVGCGQPLQDKALDATRVMSFRDNLYVDMPSEPHVGFSDAIGAPAEPAGFAAARARLAAFSNAAPVRVVSPDGALVVRLGCDAIARLCVRAEKDGADFLAPSPMGLTVNGEDLGRLVLLENPVVDVAENGNARRLVADLTGVVDGPTGVKLELLVRNNGFAYRYRMDGEGPWDVVGEHYSWRLAPFVDASAAFLSEVETDAGLFAGPARTVWRTCRIGGTVVQTPELAVARVAAYESARLLAVSDDPAVEVRHAAHGNGRTATASLRAGYRWSDGSTGPKALSWTVDAAPALEEGWNADGRDVVFVTGGKTSWRLGALANKATVAFVTRPGSTAPSDGVLDFAGCEAAFRAVGTPLVPGSAVSFLEGPGLASFAAAKTLAATNEGFVAHVQKGGLRPFANLERLLLGSPSCDLAVGCKAGTDYGIDPVDNAFGRSVPTLREIGLSGRNVTLRNAFGDKFAGTPLADVRVVASDGLDLGWSAFNVNTGGGSDSAGSVTNVLLEAKGRMALGGCTFRCSLASNAMVRVRAAKTSQVVLDHRDFAAQYYRNRPFVLDWSAPPPRVEDAAALRNNVIDWRVDIDFASSFPMLADEKTPVELPVLGTGLHLALPKVPSSGVVWAGGAARPFPSVPKTPGRWYQGAEDPGEGVVALGSGSACWRQADWASVQLTEKINWGEFVSKGLLVHARDALSALAQADGIRIVSPNRALVSDAAYGSNFTLRVTGAGVGVWLVAPVLDEARIGLAETRQALLDAVRAEWSASARPVTVPGRPALWYAVRQSDRLETLDAAAWTSPACGDAEGKVRLDVETSPEANFYQVEVRVTDEPL